MNLTVLFRSKKSLMVKRNYVLLVSVVSLLLPLPVLLYVDVKLAVVWLSFVFLVIAYSLYKKAVGQELIVALLFALFITSYQTYTYTTLNLYIGTINLFPLVAWTAGLVLLRELYERYEGKLKLLSLSILYLVCLFALEFVGYYLLGIQIAKEYPSLFGTGIIHGPPFIHLFYVAAGPLYLIVTDYLSVE